MLHPLRNSLDPDVKFGQSGAQKNYAKEPQEGIELPPLNITNTTYRLRRLSFSGGKDMKIS